MKLVRDLIPEMILKSGRIPLVHIATPSQYKQWLRSKLSEEIEEWLASETIEEMADIIEVLEAIARVQGHTLQDILQVKEKKQATHGGFSKQIVLEKIVGTTLSSIINP